MSKKLISLIISVVMLVSVLTGCSLFEKNIEKNMKQVLAEIKLEQEEDGKSIEKSIYKYQLMESINANGAQMQQQGYSSIEEIADALLDQLVTNELVLIDIEKKIESGEIDWRNGEKEYDDKKFDYTDINAVQSIVYNAIDDALRSIKNEILTLRGLDIPEVSYAEAPSTSTTYPIQEDENKDEDAVVREEESFADTLDKNRSRWPGYYGDEADKSLGREMMRRFISMIKDRVKDNYAVTDYDKEEFKKDDQEIENIINTKGIEHVYPILGDRHYMKFLVGDNAEKQTKINRLIEYLSDAVNVTDNDVKTEFNARVTNQKLSFSADASAYATAVRGGQDIYYYPNNRFFYVKHILLPFNAAQTDKLSAYKSSGKRTPAQIEAYRRNLVSEIVVYPHVDGEDDVNNPTTVNAVFTKLKAEMAAAETDLKTAERTFDKYIYMYNTDPGIFNQPNGYAEVTELLSGESETFMPEFAKTARELYKDYRPGQVHTDFAITDYGVHIMYYASKTFTGREVTVNDYQTPGEYKTYFEIIKAELETQREEEEFNKWRDRTIVYYEKTQNAVTKYEKRYADIAELLGQ